MAVDLVIRIPITLANGIRAVVARMGTESMSSICCNGLRLRMAIPPGSYPISAPCHSRVGGTTLIKIRVPEDIVMGTRFLAQMEGVTLGCVLSEGVRLFLVSQGMEMPKRGLSRLRPGRRVSAPIRNHELPIVILDDDVAA